MPGARVDRLGEKKKAAETLGRAFAKYENACKKKLLLKDVDGKDVSPIQYLTNWMRNSKQKDIFTTRSDVLSMSEINKYEKNKNYDDLKDLILGKIKGVFQGHFNIGYESVAQEIAIAALNAAVDKAMRDIDVADEGHAAAAAAAPVIPSRNSNGVTFSGKAPDKPLAAAKAAAQGLASSESQSQSPKHQEPLFDINRDSLAKFAKPKQLNDFKKTPIFKHLQKLAKKESEDKQGVVTIDYPDWKRVRCEIDSIDSQGFVTISIEDGDNESIQIAENGDVRFYDPDISGYREPNAASEDVKNQLLMAKIVSLITPENLDRAFNELSINGSDIAVDPDSEVGSAAPADIPLWLMAADSANIAPNAAKNPAEAAAQKFGKNLALFLIAKSNGKDVSETASVMKSLGNSHKEAKEQNIFEDDFKDKKLSHLAGDGYARILTGEIQGWIKEEYKIPFLEVYNHTISWAMQSGYLSNDEVTMTNFIRLIAPVYAREDARKKAAAAVAEAASPSSSPSATYAHARPSVTSPTVVDAPRLESIVGAPDSELRKKSTAIYVKLNSLMLKDKRASRLSKPLSSVNDRTSQVDSDFSTSLMKNGLQNIYDALTVVMNSAASPTGNNARIEATESAYNQLKDVYYDQFLRLSAPEKSLLTFEEALQNGPERFWEIVGNIIDNTASQAQNLISQAKRGRRSATTPIVAPLGEEFFAKPHEIKLDDTSNLLDLKNVLAKYQDGKLIDGTVRPNTVSNGKYRVGYEGEKITLTNNENQSKIITIKFSGNPEIEAQNVTVEEVNSVIYRLTRKIRDQVSGADNKVKASSQETYKLSDREIADLNLSGIYEHFVSSKEQEVDDKVFVKSNGDRGYKKDDAGNIVISKISQRGVLPQIIISRNVDGKVEVKSHQNLADKLIARPSREDVIKILEQFKQRFDQRESEKQEEANKQAAAAAAAEADYDSYAAPVADENTIDGEDVKKIRELSGRISQNISIYYAASGIAIDDEKLVKQFNKDGKTYFASINDKGEIIIKQGDVVVTMTAQIDEEFEVTHTDNINKKTAYEIAAVFSELQKEKMPEELTPVYPDDVVPAQFADDGAAAAAVARVETNSPTPSTGSGASHSSDSSDSKPLDPERSALVARLIVKIGRIHVDHKDTANNLGIEKNKNIQAEFIAFTRGVHDLLPKGSGNGVDYEGIHENGREIIERYYNNNPSLSANLGIEKEDLLNALRYSIQGLSIDGYNNFQSSVQQRLKDLRTAIHRYTNPAEGDEDIYASIDGEVAPDYKDVSDSVLNNLLAQYSTSLHKGIVPFTDRNSKNHAEESIAQVIMMQDLMKIEALSNTGFVDKLKKHVTVKSSAAVAKPIVAVDSAIQYTRLEPSDTRINDIPQDPTKFLEYFMKYGNGFFERAGKESGAKVGIAMNRAKISVVGTNDTYVGSKGFQGEIVSAYKLVLGIENRLGAVITDENRVKIEKLKDLYKRNYVTHDRTEEPLPPPPAASSAPVKRIRGYGGRAMENPEAHARAIYLFINNEAKVIESGIDMQFIADPNNEKKYNIQITAAGNDPFKIKFDPETKEYRIDQGSRENLSAADDSFKDTLNNIHQRLLKFSDFASFDFDKAEQDLLNAIGHAEPPRSSPAAGAAAIPASDVVATPVTTVGGDELEESLASDGDAETQVSDDESHDSVTILDYNLKIIDDIKTIQKNTILGSSYRVKDEKKDRLFVINGVRYSLEIKPAEKQEGSDDKIFTLVFANNESEIIASYDQENEEFKISSKDHSIPVEQLNGFRHILNSELGIEDSDLSTAIKEVAEQVKNLSKFSKLSELSSYIRSQMTGLGLGVFRESYNTKKKSYVTKDGNTLLTDITNRDPDLKQVLDLANEVVESINIASNNEVRVKSVGKTKKEARDPEEVTKHINGLLEEFTGRLFHYIVKNGGNVNNPEKYEVKNLVDLFAAQYKELARYDNNIYATLVSIADKPKEGADAVELENEKGVKFRVKIAESSSYNRFTAFFGRKVSGYEKGDILVTKLSADGTEQAGYVAYKKNGDVYVSPQWRDENGFSQNHSDFLSVARKNHKDLVEKFAPMAQEGEDQVKPLIKAPSKVPSIESTIESIQKNTKEEFYDIKHIFKIGSRNYQLKLKPNHKKTQTNADGVVEVVKDNLFTLMFVDVEKTNEFPRRIMAYYDQDNGEFKVSTGNKGGFETNNNENKGMDAARAFKAELNEKLQDNKSELSEAINALAKRLSKTVNTLDATQSSVATTSVANTVDDSTSPSVSDPATADSSAVSADAAASPTDADDFDIAAGVLAAAAAAPTSPAASVSNPAFVADDASPSTPSDAAAPTPVDSNNDEEIGDEEIEFVTVERRDMSGDIFTTEIEFVTVEKRDMIEDEFIADILLPTTPTSPSTSPSPQYRRSTSLNGDKISLAL